MILLLVRHRTLSGNSAMLSGVLGVLAPVTELFKSGTWPCWVMKSSRAASERVWLLQVGRALWSLWLLQNSRETS